MILEVYKGGNKVGEVRKALNRLCSESKKKKRWVEAVFMQAQYSLKHKNDLPALLASQYAL